MSHTTRFVRSLLAASVILITLCTVPVGAETTNCTVIDALPYTIVTSGVYCLTANYQPNLAVGAAITIDANEVVLDLNGHMISNLSGLATQAYGIYALNRSNLTVRNGGVMGFLIGVQIKAENGYGMSLSNVVEDMRAGYNYYQGINVEGKASVVRNNHVLYIGRTTYFGANVSGYGIRVAGPSPRLLNNDVSQVFKSGTGVAYGIFLVSVSNGFAYENRVAVVRNGIVFFGASTGKYKDNLTSGVTTAFSGGTDAGGNH